jgi:hypothetical protein
VLTRHGLLAATLTISVCSASLPGVGQVIATEKGTVEFLGLETWSPERIQQRLGYTSPERLHYCAADLKGLGFPEAVVVGYTEEGRRYTVVTVVEPQRASEIVYKSHPNGNFPLPENWRTLEGVTKESDFLSGGILDYSRTLPGARADRPWLSDGTPQTWWPAVRALANEADFERAEQVIGLSSDVAARALAALVLMNFSSRDASWHSLVSGLRDPDDLVQMACLQSLNSLTTFHPRKVDWSPSVPDLAHLLHGTDLFAFQFLLKALSATEVEPALARSLLGQGGGRLLLAYLRAQHDDQRGLAHDFLIRLHGSDLGDDPRLWDKWIATL